VPTDYKGLISLLGHLRWSNVSRRGATARDVRASTSSGENEEAKREGEPATEAVSATSRTRIVPRPGEADNRW